MSSHTFPEPEPEAMQWQSCLNLKPARGRTTRPIQSKIYVNIHQSNVYHILKFYANLLSRLYMALIFVQGENL